VESTATSRRSIFLTGGTGYIGRRLIPMLLRRGHGVTAVVRHGSESHVPVGAKIVAADPLREDSYTMAIAPADTFVHLIGTPHPSPAKARQFVEIDLASIRVATKAARDAAMKHFVYVSVAQPAPMMKAFIDVRRQGEEMLRASGLNVTFVRPWYVLGPGHRWPVLLMPFYWIAGCLPAARESAERLGLITLRQMLNALVWAIENPAHGVRVVEVPQIRTITRDAVAE
jgi:uncharacterized protein YbjT (DUF2867 family)